VIDIGGTSVKLLVSGQHKRRMLSSGRKMTPDKMVRKTLELVSDWDYSVVSIGYPGPVLCGRPICEPYNLGRGWVGFDFAAAFRRPVEVVNDAAMQALGSYNGGTMLFLGLGTGLGTAMIVDGIIEPMELGHLRYRKATYEDYLGRVGLKRLGKKCWRHYVEDVVERLIAVLEPDDVVIGGGNVKKLKKLPLGRRAGTTTTRSSADFGFGRSRAKRHVQVAIHKPSGLMPRSRSEHVPNFAGCAGDKNAFHATARPGLRGTYPSPLADNPWKSASPRRPSFLGPADQQRKAESENRHQIQIPPGNDLIDRHLHVEGRCQQDHFPHE
jgi:polyphosphate glucokinase